MSGNYGLKINEDVLENMAGIAATEVEGVTGTVAALTDIKGVLGKGFKGVKATVAQDGEISIDVCISVKRTANAKEVARAVQDNVKEKVQNMTGSAVSRVNVRVADIVFEDEDTIAEA